MKKLRFALAGTGFWSRFQLHGWRELPGVECVAVYNRTVSKATALAEEFGIPSVYDNYEDMLAREQIDFVDIVTGVDQHAAMAKAAANRSLAVVCQKPLAVDFESAREMVAHAEEKKSLLLVNENWRWQPQIRAFADAVKNAPLGEIWRAHINYSNSFPVFANQPFLKELDQFILTDIGTHILDTMRFLFGEAETVYAQTHGVAPGIRGEDAASVLCRMKNGMSVYLNMSYASRVRGESFPEVFILVEGQDASVSLDINFNVHVTTATGTVTTHHAPPPYSWADPRYGVVHASIVAAQRNLLAALRGEQTAETTGKDNIETLRLVFACYESARKRQVVSIRNSSPSPF